MGNARTLLGKRIRSLRRRMDLSQEELAERARTSYKYLGQAERGTANLTVDVLEKIAAALGVGMGEMFDYEHELGPDQLRKKIRAMTLEADEKELQAAYRIMKAVIK